MDFFLIGSLQNILWGLDMSNQNISKICISCGNFINKEAKFCEKCGASQTTTLKCNSCGKTLSKESTFCSFCGLQISAKPQKKVNENSKKVAGKKPSFFLRFLSKILPIIIIMMMTISLCSGLFLTYRAITMHCEQEYSLRDFQSTVGVMLSFEKNKGNITELDYKITTNYLLGGITLIISILFEVIFGLILYTRKLKKIVG